MDEKKSWCSTRNLWVFTYTDKTTGMIKEFKNVRVNGKVALYSFYHDDGTLESKMWHNTGLLWKHEFWNRGIHGRRKAWHSNGQLGADELWKNGCLDGKQQSWYDNGSPQMFIFSRNGESHGEWKEWSEHGRLIIHEFYRNGQCVDPNFMVSKKCKFGKLKRKFRHKKYRLLMDTFLISDFAKFSV